MPLLFSSDASKQSGFVRVGSFKKIENRELILTCCNLSTGARAAVNDLMARMSPGPADPDEVSDGLELIAEFYPEVATLDAIPWLVESFERIMAVSA